MLSHFRVQGFKSLLDVEIELAPLVVLFGPNAAGKSNVLEALLLLSRLVTEPTLSAAFEPPMRGYPLEAFSLPPNGLEGLLQQDKAELTLEASAKPGRRDGSTDTQALTYKVSIRIQPRSGALEIVDEFLGKPFGKTLLAYIRPKGTPGPAPRDVVDLLGNQLSAWRTYYLDPRVAMREPQPPREVSDIGPRGEWIAPFLYRLKESEAHRKHFLAIGRALRSAIPLIEGLDVDLDPRRGTLDIIIRQEGTPYSSRVISEGTLRVLALCCIAGNPWPGKLVAFEEPENGVHPRRIEVIANLLASMAAQDRVQVVVTTHSPTLIAAMLQQAKAAPEHTRLLRCAQHGGATTITPFVATGPLFEDAEIRRALTSPEDDAEVVEAMLLRGWLDG
ncbi:MAG TPA: AAA family ATPase [Thermoanaerobaculia bacterium]|nr:AAA family ATPase [Thermoanaerobaculia bacterium]